MKPKHTVEFNIESIVATENNGITDNIDYSRMLAHSIEAVLQHLRSIAFFPPSDKPQKEQIGLHRDVLVKYTTTHYNPLSGTNTYGTAEGVFIETLSIGLYSFSTELGDIQEKITDLVKKTCQQHKETNKKQEIERLTTILTTEQFPEFSQTGSGINEQRDAYIKGVCKTIASLAKEDPSYLDYCTEQSAKLLDSGKDQLINHGFYLWTAITREFEGDERLKQKIRTLLSNPSSTMTERYMGIEDAPSLDKNEYPHLIARIVGDNTEELFIRVRASGILMTLLPYTEGETQKAHIGCLSKLKEDMDQTNIIGYRNSLPTTFYKWLFDSSKNDFLRDYPRLESIRGKKR